MRVERLSPSCKFTLMMGVDSAKASARAPCRERNPMTTPQVTGRVNQKRRTHAAIVAAAAELMLTGGEVTMPEVAKLALVSEATAYRYFPDLASLLSEAMADTLPEPGQ